MSLERQAAYLAVAEHIAYVNPRVAAFSQYLMSDDPPRSERLPLRRASRAACAAPTARPKPAYEGFRLPLAVEVYGAQRRAVGARAPAARA